MHGEDRQSVNLRPEMTISTKVHVEFDRGVKMGKGEGEGDSTLQRVSDSLGITESDTDR